MSEPEPRCVDCRTPASRRMLRRHGNVWLCVPCEHAEHDVLLGRDHAHLNDARDAERMAEEISG